jgi:hypothetical protein
LNDKIWKILEAPARTKTEMIKGETEAVGIVIEWQNIENIRGKSRTKIESIKEETEAVGTVSEWQNVENIRGHKPGQRQRRIKKRLRLLEQSFFGKIWKYLRPQTNDKDRNRGRETEETEEVGTVIGWQNMANTALEVPRGPKWSQNKKSLGPF